MITASSKILLTGGTGSFGKAFISHIVSSHFRGTLRIFSRDEFKQFELKNKYGTFAPLHFFLGDVRDKDRLKRAMSGVDIVIHAAALKQIPTIEYNPFEAVKTNILGTQNVIDCAIDLKVKKVLLISSDKAVSPVNLYGATKMVAEKIFVQANSYASGQYTLLSVVRYGNVMNSRGSVVPVFLEQKRGNVFTITDERMTRFWITLSRGVKFVIKSMGIMHGGEIFVPKIPSVTIVDIARALSRNAGFKVVGIRPSEKLHEVLINEEEARHSIDMGTYFIVKPEFVFWKSKNFKGGKKLPEGFVYRSDLNRDFLGIGDIKKLLSKINSPA